MTAETYFIHTDHLGTPQVITDMAQAVAWQADYDAFGHATVSVASIENNLRLPGQYYDAETGNHYNYFRDYDPETGRYLQSDPIGLAGGNNTYLYANGNPLRFTDPLGLFCFSPLMIDVIASGAGGAAGGAWGGTPWTVAIGFGIGAFEAVVADRLRRITRPDPCHCGSGNQSDYPGLAAASGARYE